MSSLDDKDNGLTLESLGEEDVATYDSFSFIKPKKLTQEEVMVPGVVWAMKSRLDELNKDLLRLRLKEEQYNNLRVEYASLRERIMVYSKASIFWDFVLIVMPLLIGLLLNAGMEDVVIKIFLICASISLIAGALVARYNKAWRGGATKNKGTAIAHK